jgi:hypothetical protein
VDLVDYAETLTHGKKKKGGGFRMTTSGSGRCAKLCVREVRKICCYRNKNSCFVCEDLLHIVRVSCCFVTQLTKRREHGKSDPYDQGSNCCTDC